MERSLSLGRLMKCFITLKISELKIISPEDLDNVRFNSDGTLMVCRWINKRKVAIFMTKN